MMSMKIHTWFSLMLLLCASIFSARANAQTDFSSSGQPTPKTSNSDPSSWLFPVDQLNEVLPRWVGVE